MLAACADPQRALPVADAGYPKDLDAGRYPDIVAVEVPNRDERPAPPLTGQRCPDDRFCPPGTRCIGGRCAADPCSTENTCGDTATCFAE
jgi:hypothetical protein